MKFRDSILPQIVKNYDVYLENLLKNTAFVGLVSLIINWIYINSPFHEFKINWEIQGLIGFVIGLLLVFRTNTAYDRWWEGRKMLGEFSRTINELYMQATASEDPDMHIQLKSLVIKYFKFLKYGDFKDEISMMKEFEFIYSRILRSYPDNIRGISYRSLAELGQSLYNGERIKKTPIPIAYKLHIKVTSSIYIFSLPFGSFYSMGIYSSIMVMILYFLISGIEIISSEIEDPFRGDPNDLPMERYKNEIFRYLNSKD